MNFKMVMQMYDFFENIATMIKYSPILLLMLLVASCGNKGDSTSTTSKAVDVPKFNSDSAYAFVQKQVDFGPRVPNTEAHRNAGLYLENKLRSYGAKVIVQAFKAPTVDGTVVDLKNIIASFNPEKQKRILLAAHWDTRPYADKDLAKPDAPFDGANDGGSGVGVLLEVARQLQSKHPRAGVDIVLFDGEDWGPKDNGSTRPAFAPGWEEWWCLGSQYWSRNLHKPGYRAYFGILLDMVGAPNARFFREGTSEEYAPRILDKVWSAGAIAGYGDFFISQQAGALTDDNYFVSKNANIPMVDIVQYNSNTGFGSFHHTTGDNMSAIDKKTLQAVGTTVLYVVFQEE
jgi:glutaminyl-peptide cyclotransferase